MEDKKDNSKTICIIILSVILVIGLVGFICYDNIIINNITKEERQNANNASTLLSETEALSIASDIYKKAYEALNGNINTMEEITIDGNIYYRMDLELIKPYFSTKAMTKFKENFVEKDGKYYDIYNDGGKHSYLEDLIVHKTIFGGTDQGLRPLTIVHISQDTIYASGQLIEGYYETDIAPLSIIFIKENGNWVIDSFE